MSKQSDNIGICETLDLLNGLEELGHVLENYSDSIYHTDYMKMAETITFLEEYVKTHKVEINQSIDLRIKL